LVLDRGERKELRDLRDGDERRGKINLDFCVYVLIFIDKGGGGGGERWFSYWS
jgi:hypothetical protein